MSVFKVGQRVRIVGLTNPGWISYAGREATILSELDPSPPTISGKPAHRIAIDGDGLTTWSQPCYLVPLTDPKADAFIESVKKWKPEPVVPALPAKVKA